jgi:TM2 domain-containing membrane protein YozV
MVAAKDLTCMVTFIVLTFPTFIFPKEDQFYVSHLMVGILVANFCAVAASKMI